MSFDSVYMIGCLNGSYVKIGYSNDPGKRLKELQTGCPFPLTLLATVPGDANLEGAFHLWFADLRVNGEWFRFPMRDATDQMREAVWLISQLDGCPFDWTELYVDVKHYVPPNRPTLRDRLADRFRTESVNVTRARLLTASGQLKSTRDAMRDDRCRETASA